MVGLVRGIIDRRKDVFAFKRRIIGEDLLEGRAAGDQFEYVGHSNPLSADAGAATAHAEHII